MKKLMLILGLVLCSAGAPRAQLAGPNEIGVSMGHWHLNVHDVEANKKFWTLLGGTVTPRPGGADFIKFPGVLVLLTVADPSGATVGSDVNHVGFLVPDVQKTVAIFRAAGLAVEPGANGRLDQIYVVSPDGVRVEFLEDKTMTIPIRHHHVHFNVPESAVPQIQAWYGKTFGAKPGVRANFQAADLPGVNLTFSATTDSNVGTKGRALDHIGFEVRNLEAFCKGLEASGVKFDRPYGKSPTGVAVAFLTDPWGTRIELTEGLDKL